MSDTERVVRAWDGNRWVCRYVDSPELAESVARAWQDMIAHAGRPPGTCAWLLLEIARTDATGEITHQWHGGPTGYKRVLGR